MDRIFPEVRGSDQNFGTWFRRLILRAGVVPWPKLFQNLRASRATELVNEFPSHVCCSWLGHSEAIADANYRMTTDQHVETAITKPTGKIVDAGERVPLEKVARICARSVCLKGPAPRNAQNRKPLVFQGHSMLSRWVQPPDWAMTDLNRRHPRCKRGALAN